MFRVLAPMISAAGHARAGELVAIWFEPADRSSAIIDPTGETPSCLRCGTAPIAAVLRDVVAMLEAGTLTGLEDGDARATRAELLRRLRGAASETAPRSRQQLHQR
jgi:hypothetical protein